MAGVEAALVRVRSGPELRTPAPTPPCRQHRPSTQALKEYHEASRFSIAAGRAGLAPGARPAGRRAQGAPGRGQALRAAGQPAADDRAGRQDRGGRVLLVRLPALQRLRAAARRLGQEAARRRGLPPRAGGLPRAAYVRTRRSSTRSRPWARSSDAPQGLLRDPRERQRLTSEADIAAFVGDNGVDGAKFTEAYQLLRRADQGRQASSWPRPTRSTACRRSASRAASSRRARWPAATNARWRDRLPDPARAQEGLTGPPAAPPARCALRAAVACCTETARCRAARLVARMACKFRAAKMPTPAPHALDPGWPCLWRWPCCRRRCPGREGRPRQAAWSIEADQPGTVDLQRQVVVFNGNVVISQGTMVMRAERVEVRETPDGYRTAAAIGSAGKPATYRQKRDGVDEYSRRRGRPHRIRRPRRHPALRRQRRGAPPARQRGGRRDHRRADHLGQHRRGLQRPGRRGHAPANPSGRVRAVLAPRAGSRPRPRAAAAGRRR